MFTDKLFATVTTWKEHKCPRIDDWMQKMCYIHTMEYYSATKRTKMPCAATCKELETVILSEVSQKKKEQYHMILEPKKMMQLVIYKTESQVYKNNM